MGQSYYGLLRLLSLDRSSPGYQPMYVLPGRWGVVQPGTLDLKARPTVHNLDGSTSTVRSITVTDDQGRAILLPTVVNDQVVSPRQAIAHYKQTGQHLGVFKNEAAADQYATALHNQQAQFYGVG